MPLLTENSFQRLSDPIVDPAEETTLKLLEKIKELAQSLIENPQQTVNNEQLRREIEQLWSQYEEQSREWVNEAMPQAYLRGIQKTNGAVPSGMEANFGITPTIELAAVAGVVGGGGEIASRAADILDGYPKHHTIYTAFQDAAYNRFNQTRLPVIRDVQGKIRDLTIQASEAAYRDADGFTRRKMTQQLMNRFADDNITGIRYADGRTMKLDTYSEMAARSMTGNAARQASINRQQEYGLDLVQISQHFPTSDLCRPWHGRVYSLSGTDSKYPPLDEAISGGLYHANSYIKDMETYTRQGWKLIKDLDGSEQVFSLNPETHIPEWVGISELHSHESEKMIELKSNSFDLCVTLDHDLYIGTPRRNKGKGRTHKYKFEKANKAIDRGFFSQLRCINWMGETQDMPINGINESDFARLLAWFISDGHVDKDSVRIAKSKEPHVTKMKPTMENIGFYHDGTKFTIYNKEWAEYFNQFGKSYEKFLPDWIKNNRPDIIEFFLDAYIIGDGNIKTNTYKGHDFDSVTYFTTSKRLAEDLGEVIIKGGYYPSFNLQKSKGVSVKHHNGEYEGNHNVWRISRNTIKESYYLNSPSNKHKGISAEIIDYNDMVYCVTLKKNHVMWVRRNGKTTWSGNCKHYQSAYIPGTSNLPDEEMSVTKNREQYELEQTQRYNERQIRRWKRREAAAVTDDAREQAREKINQWQKRNRQLVDEHDFLRRKYTRESITATGRNVPNS